jgi:hypothetical protein
VDVFAFGLLVYEFWLQEKCDQRLLRLADDPVAQLFGAGSLQGSGGSHVRHMSSSGGLAGSSGMSLSASSAAPKPFPPTLQKLIQRWYACCFLSSSFFSFFCEFIYSNLSSKSLRYYFLYSPLFTFAFLSVLSLTVSIDVEPQNRIEFKRIEELNQVLGKHSVQSVWRE